MELKPLLTSFRAKAGYEIIQNTIDTNQLRFIGRVPEKRVADWLDAVSSLLDRSGEHWSIDVSRHYFKRAGKLVFAWRVIVRAKDLEATVNDIINVLHATPASTRSELKEVPLIGADLRARNPAPGARGAFTPETFAPGRR